MDAPLPGLKTKSQVEWKISGQPVAYPEALAQMEARAAAIADGTASEQVWLLEHPPIYTAGTSAADADLIEARFPVYRSGRGGQFTYHGPGQRVAYAMLDLKSRSRKGSGPDVRAYVQDLEQWLIETLAQLGVKGERRAGRVGIWVQRGTREDKIAALGVRIKRWVSLHGVALNVAPDLSHFDGIVPCGIRAHGVTSLADLGIVATMADVDRALKQNFKKIFG